MSIIRDAAKSVLSSLFKSKPKEREVYMVSSRPATAETGQFFSNLEERVYKTVPLEKLEKLYHLDFLTFRIVNDYIDSMVGPGFILEGDKRVIKKLYDWAEEVGLTSIMEEIIRDNFLAGNAWVELGYNEMGNDISKLQMINPKFIDYIRDESTQFVKRNPKTSEIIGFKRIRSLEFQDVEWRKDKIIVGGNTVSKFTSSQDGRDRIAHFKLWGLGESYLGSTPLEAAYRQAILRLNVSRNVGESAYRSEGLIITVGDELMIPSNDQLDKIVEEFRNVESNTIFGFKSKPPVKIDRMPSPDLKDREKLLYYYADAFSCGMGKPLCLLMEPTERGRSGVEEKGIEFEYKIESLQKRLATQIRDKLFYRYMKAHGIPLDKLKKVIFKSYMSSVKLAKARRIATLARMGLIRYDPELEKKLRQLEDLPISGLDEIIEDWKKTGKLPETQPKPEKDIRVRLQELEDRLDINEK